MRPGWTKIGVLFKRILAVLIVLATAATIFYMFPHRGKFPYEYQKGSFWGHQNLIAPFDFPVLKSDEQIELERDSIIQALNPYFLMDQALAEQRMTDFVDNWTSIWDQVSEILSDNEDFLSLPDNWSVSYVSHAQIMLDSLYQIGIADPSVVDAVPDWDSRIVNVIVDQVSSERQPGQINIPLGAYEWLQRELTDPVSLAPAEIDLLSAIFQEIGFNRFIEANLQLDILKNEESRAEAVDNMSLTRGLIQRGQRIISEGDMVNEERLMLLDSFRKSYENELGDVTSRWIVRIGQVLIILISLSILILYLFHYRKEILTNNVKFGYIFLMLLLSIVGGALILRSESVSIYLVPFVIFPVIIRNFFDSRTALFFHLVAMLIMGFLVPNGFEFVLMQVLVGFAAIISFQHLHRRGQLVMTALIVFVSYALIYLAMSMMQEGQLHSIEWIDLAWLGGNSLLVLLSYPMIFIFEKLFGFISDVTLIELSDSNHPVLRRMAEEAPGTFQHSLQVANLSESVVRQIGGNPLLVRTGAMYHDIGKTDSPFYFNENQATGSNPHDQMSNVQSAEIIINHVTRGAEIAKKHRLPKPIIDFILTHHGTSRAQYFLKMHQKENEGEKIDEQLFEYPGPKPYNKETAVLMMADAIEAASRSLSEYTPETIGKLVDKIIDHQLEEGQFEQAELTFRDIYRAREIFKQKLINIYHARIAYPK